MSTYALELEEEVRLTLEEARGSSPETQGVLVQSLHTLFSQLAGSHLNHYELKRSILSSVAQGKRAGLVTHHPTDMHTLTQCLAQPTEPLSIGGIICPDWSWHYEGSTVVYDMDSLNSGLPKTAEPVASYLKALSQIAARHGVPLRYTAHIAAWEASTDEDRQMVNQSAQATANYLTHSTDGKAEISIEIHDPPDFHPQVAALAHQLLHTDQGRPKVEAVHHGRQPFYKDRAYSLADAAKELAAAILGWQLVEEDLTLVSTSPTIARASLSGNSKPWIQLQTGYRG